MFNLELLKPFFDINIEILKSWKWIIETLKIPGGGTIFAAKRESEARLVREFFFHRPEGEWGRTILYLGSFSSSHPLPIIQNFKVEIF